MISLEAPLSIKAFPDVEYSSPWNMSKLIGNAPTLTQPVMLLSHFPCTATIRDGFGTPRHRLVSG